MNKPRPFNHQPIYIDEHRERLEQVEQRARQELGLRGAQSSRLPVGPQSSRLHGVFSAARQQQRKGRGQLLCSIPMLLSVLLVLLATVLLIAFSNGHT